MLKITDRLIAINNRLPVCASKICSSFSNLAVANSDNVVKPVVFQSFLNKNAVDFNCTQIQLRLIHTSNVKLYAKKKKKEYDGSLVMLSEFENVKNKNRETFLDMIRIYNERFETKFRFVDFVTAALKQMEAFGVHKDLEIYKKLIDIFPKGRYIPDSYLLADLWYYPTQVECGFEILEQMEHFGVYPDKEVDDLLLNVFGRKSKVYRRFKQQMYWLPKVRHLTPWPLPRPLPNDALELAKLAIARITSVDMQTVVDVYRTEEVPDSIDKTWIVNGQSPAQIQLLNKHDKKKPVIVEGGDRVYLRNHAINYFILKSDEEPYEGKELPDKDDISHLQSPWFNPNYVYPDVPTVHEQDGETIYAVCATGTSSKDSLLSWVRLLQEKENPVLGEVAVLFRFKSPETLPVPRITTVAKNEKEGSATGS